MICTNCGAEVSETAKVCGYCGHRLRAVAAQVSSPIPPQKDDPKRMASVWIWAVAGMGILVFIVALLGIGIVLFVPLQIDLGLPPETAATLVPTEQIELEPPPEATATRVQTEEPSPTSVPTQIIVEPFHNDNDGTKLSELAKETGPGTWTANISSNTPVVLSWGWCTTTQQILEQNLQHMQILFYANGIDVTGSMTQFPGPIEGGVCLLSRGHPILACRSAYHFI
ncbi:MAG: zinc ribbon domain-containing protein [Chloroflexi bacterium]|nr:zinc ribbon domain-containing protein [Chloroflexota bacterium]